MSTSWQGKPTLFKIDLSSEKWLIDRTTFTNIQNQHHMIKPHIIMYWCWIRITFSWREQFGKHAKHEFILRCQLDYVCGISEQPIFPCMGNGDREALNVLGTDTHKCEEYRYLQWANQGRYSIKWSYANHTKHSVYNSIALIVSDRNQTSRPPFMEYIPAFCTPPPTRLHALPWYCPCW